MNKYKKLAKSFRKEVNKQWGKKCEDFDFGCIVCQSHRILDDLEELGNFLDSINKIHEKSQHSHNRKS
ncbi:MAG: hypothetical protein AAB877_03530 [Patescibacteria group bacterium]